MGWVLVAFRWVWGALDFLAQISGGWPLFSAAVVSTAISIWGFVTTNGPLAVLIGLFTAATTVILVDAGMGAWSRFRRARRVHVEIASRLDELTDKGAAIPSLPLHHDDASEAIEEWRTEVLDVLKGDLFSEYYGFKSLEYGPAMGKLRLITMRFSNKHNIRTSDIERFRSETRNGNR